MCPLVSKVHAEARRYAAGGHRIALVGHAGHVEVEGTMGEAPDSIVLVETPEDARALELEEGQKVAYLTQTTLSLDDTADVVDALRERVPDLVGPPSADICYATQNRQDAVKRICEEATLVLVVGSKTSSNANRLVEVAHAKGTDAYLIDDETDLEVEWLEGHETVGSPPARPRRRCSSSALSTALRNWATRSARTSRSRARTSSSASRKPPLTSRNEDHRGLPGRDGAHSAAACDRSSRNARSSSRSRASSRS